MIDEIYNSRIGAIKTDHFSDEWEQTAIPFEESLTEEQIIMFHKLCDLQSETDDLFMSVIMYRLKQNGRAAVILPDGFLFGTDNAKVAIQVRNRSMIDRADLVVCCIQHKSGGAYRTILYAEKQGKKIVNLAEEN